MLALIIAGEAIFILPFGLARVFRPTLLDYFQISNTQLGVIMSAYGIVAILAYFAGGPLADRFSARLLMGIALVSTAVGGVGLATMRDPETLRLLWAFWGLTTILLFWAPLLRATREWGGDDKQGRAYGLLDGGRGLVAALFASGTVALYSTLLPVAADKATLAQRAEALETVIWVTVALTGGVALLIWIFVREPSTGGGEESAAEPRPKLTLSGVRAALRMPAIRAQAVIIVCAYVGYKSTDNVALFARDVFGYNDVESARLSTLTFYARPVGTIIAGLVADRFRSSQVIVWCFAVVIAGNLVLALGLIPPGVAWVLIVTLATTSLGIYSLRGVYFALFGEARVPLAYTGSAVGVVSVVGFTPDVFMAPLMGYLTDGTPGAGGHQQLYGVVALFGLIGLLASLYFRRAVARQPGESPASGEA